MPVTVTNAPVTAAPVPDLTAAPTTAALVNELVIGSGDNTDFYAFGLITPWRTTVSTQEVPLSHRNHADYRANNNR